MNEEMFNDLVRVLVENDIICMDSDKTCEGLSPLEEYAEQIVLRELPTSCVIDCVNEPPFEHKIVFDLGWNVDGNKTNVLRWGPFCQTIVVQLEISNWMKAFLTGNWQLHYPGEAEDAYPVLSFETEEDKEAFEKQWITNHPNPRWSPDDYSFPSSLLV